MCACLQGQCINCLVISSWARQCISSLSVSCSLCSEALCLTEGSEIQKVASCEYLLICAFPK